MVAGRENFERRLRNLTKFFRRVNLVGKQGGGKQGEGVMAGHTVTRAQLAEVVYQEIGLSHNESAELVEAVIGAISDALARGEMVKISSFGSFAVRQKGQRIGRNPKTGQEVPISPRRVLVFRASHALKDQINSGHKQPGQSGQSGTQATARTAARAGAGSVKAAPV